MEKAILNKSSSLKSKILHTRLYQGGFKQGKGTHQCIAKLLKLRKQGPLLFVDLEKAFDRVYRDKLFCGIDKRCESPDDHALASLIKEFLTNTSAQIGN